MYGYGERDRVMRQQCAVRENHEGASLMCGICGMGMRTGEKGLSCESLIWGRKVATICVCNARRGVEALTWHEKARSM